jgi:hypothetical protein
MISAPTTDTTVAATGKVSVSATVDGSPRSVTAAVGSHELNLVKRGKAWTGSIPAATWLVPGPNQIEVSTTSGNGGHQYSYRTVYREGAPADLGLTVTDTGPADAPAVHITSTTSVALVSAALNGHDLTARMQDGVLNQTLPLGGDEGLQAGANSFTVTAVTDSGTYQKVTVNVATTAGAPIAAASGGTAQPVVVTSGSLNQSTTRFRSGQSVPLDASASKPAKAGATLSYSWRVTVSPPGAATAIKDANSVHATFTPDKAGRYVVAVTVSEAGAPSSTDSTFLVLVPQLPPIGGVLVTQAPGGIYFNGTTTPSVAGQQLQLAFFDRSSLVFLGSVAGGANAASITALTDQITAVTANPQYNGSGLVSVLSSPSGYNCTPAGTCTQLETLLQALGVDDAKKTDQNDVTIHSGLPFSTISVTGAKETTAVWRSSNVPAISTALLPGVTVGRGDLSGYLQFPNGIDPALYINDTNLGFTTSSASSATTNTMQLGDCVGHLNLPKTPGMPPCQTLNSTALATCSTTGTTGGFQVVIAWAATLLVLANSTFTTNSGCGADRDQNDAAQLTAMSALVTKYVANGGTTDYVVMLQSIGSPRSQTGSAAVNRAWSDFGLNAIVALGGTGSLFSFLGYSSGYALVGYNDTTLPGFGAPFAAETSSDRPHVGNKVLPALVSGVFSRNHRNDYYPQTYGPLAGSMTDGLAAVATRPPTPWPVEETAGQRAAWMYFTAQVIAQDHLAWGPDLTGSCWGVDNFSIRDIFCDINDDSIAIPSTYTPAPTDQFTSADWHAVQTEFSVELGEVTAVNTLIEQLSAPYGDGTGNTVDMHALVKEILTKIDVPATAPTHSLWSFFLGIFGDVAGLIAGFVGVPQGQQLAGAIVNAIGQGMSISSQLIPSTDGSAGTLYDEKVRDAAGNIAKETKAAYTALAAGLHSLQSVIVSDFGKLARAANIPLSANGLTQYQASIKRGARSWATPMLLSSVYAVDPLVSGGEGVDTTNTYATGPYTGDVPNYSCYWYRTSYAFNLFAPFPSPPPGAV